MVCQVPEAETQQLRADFHNYLKTRPDLEPADFAQYTTLAESTVRSWIRGDIPGGNDVQDQMRRVLAQARAGDVLAPGGTTAVTVTENVAKRVRKVAKAGTFYRTETVRCVAQVLDFCAENCAMGVITADYGVGKTEAIKAWRRENAGKTDSFVFEFDVFSSKDKRYFMQAVGEQLGILSRSGWQNAGRAFREVCEHLRRNPCILIFDQCETLRPQICDIIRQIWDRTYDAGVGVAMLAAPILMARLKAGKMVDLGALESRIGIWAPLSGITRPEMAAVVKQEGITDVDEAAFDLWFKAIGGSFRRLARSLDLLKAKHAGRRVTEKTIVGVAGQLWGMSVGSEVVS
jgi:hypothetical protein